MTNLNLCVLQGCIVKDAELKKTVNGKSYCSFSLAVNSDRKEGDEWIEDTSFFLFTLWGVRAEKLYMYLKKGLKIEIVGKLTQTRWDDNGDKKSRIDIKIGEIHFLSKIKSDSGSENREVEHIDFENSSENSDSEHIDLDDEGLF